MLIGPRISKISQVKKNTRGETKVRSASYRFRAD